MSKPADLIAKAERIARAAHAGQVDKLGVDYFNHVRSVADAVAHLGTEYEIVGLLHDSLEDCNDPKIVSLDLLNAEFGPPIAAAVDAMTKRAGEHYTQDYIPRLLANTIARAVKHADLAHNLSRITQLDPAQQNRLRAKYDAALNMLNSAGQR